MPGQSTPPTQSTTPTLDRVLAFPAPITGEELQADRGAAGAWHRIRKLATAASVLHVTAHPDDEHSGMLTLASRGWGARTALLSLNRGEAGANAIGTELFDGLGLIRTRELVLSGRHYGLDDLYFTTAVDYGYSKTVEESFRSWDREAVLEDIVRVIRLNRPLVVVSRFHGSPRDGHGNHHAAGVLTPEAVIAAADPNRFPEQITREGLRPWRVQRLYRGGVRLGEAYHVAVNANAHSPSLGTTYQRWAATGLSLQRSQTSGRVRRSGGQVYRYERLREAEFVRQNSENVADNFFAGLDTRLTALPGLLGEEVDDEVAGGLAEVEAAIDAVVRDFDFTAPQTSAAGLARGLALLRALGSRGAAAPAGSGGAVSPELGGAAMPPELGFHLAVKERQFEDAIMAAAGVEVRAVLVGEAGGAVVVPGEEVEVEVSVESAAPGGIEVAGVSVSSGGGEMVTAAAAGRLRVRIPHDAPTARPYFARAGIHENHYQIPDSADLHLPWRQPPVFATVDLVVQGEAIARTVPVTGSVPRLPYGTLARRVDVVPAVTVSVAPAVRVVPVGAGARGPGARAGEPSGSADRAAGAADEPNPAGGRTPVRAIEVLVRLEANAPDVSVEAELELPAGWTATPSSVRRDFRSRGEAADASFSIRPPEDWSGEIIANAVARATVGGRVHEHRSGYQVIDHRDLPLARLALPARTTVRSVEAAALDGLSVGYVMGVGDEVPAAIAALGATVRALGEADLTGGTLDDLDAIVVGTRAYAVRRDLVENNRRLLDYARRGGNLVVLYQTQEFVPATMAPHPASLPRGAEEVSEEDAPVRLLAPSHPLLATPNRIVEADFDGWLEQRGSKFFAEWDAAYTPLIETHDTGQEPQRGVWLTAEVGAGRYGYMALALHRQLPYGVPGAYRILSNVLWPRPPAG